MYTKEVCNRRFIMYGTKFTPLPSMPKVLFSQWPNACVIALLDKSGNPLTYSTCGGRKHNHIMFNNRIRCYCYLTIDRKFVTAIK